MLHAAEGFIIADRRALLSALDLSRPGLAGVKAALEAGDVAKASRTFMRYYREREIASPLLDALKRDTSDIQDSIERAEGYLQGHLDDGYNVYDVPESGVDWHECPLSCLTRFPIFPALARAARHTGDPRFARFIVEHSLGYLREWPIERFTGHNTYEGWRHHYVVADPWYWCVLPERLEGWASVLDVLRASPAVDDEELMAILHRMVEETRFLAPQITKHVDAQHNSGCFMIRVLGELAVVLDDFAEAAEWHAHAAALFAQFVDAAFYPDGLYKELTMGYSAAVVLETEAPAYTFRNEPVIAGVTDRLRAIGTALAGLTKPTRNLPAFGDHYPGKIGNYVFDPFMEWLDLPWVASLLGRPAPPPPFVNWPAPGQDAWGGYYVMRSGWGAEDNYLCIDGGPWGTGHQHCDRLTFDLTALGTDFLVDTGATKYASNEPDALLSTMYAGFLHNVITVDGVDEFVKDGGYWETREPLRNRWETGGGYTLFEGSYDFAPVKPVRWTRRVLFVDELYWLLQDVLTSEQAAADLEQNFQFKEDITITFEGNLTVATAPNGARLLLLPLESPLAPTLTIGDREPKTSYSSQYEINTAPRDFPFGRGWVARFTKAPVPAPAVTYVGETPLPVTLTLALIPLPAGKSLADIPAITREVRGQTTLWRLPMRDGVLTWETSAEGQWCRK